MTTTEAPIETSNASNSTITIERAQPKMTIDSWQDKFMDIPVYFRIVWMKPDACWIWMGSAQPALNSLSVAMNTKFGKVPLGTDIIGWEQAADGAGKQYAQRLAMNFKKKASDPNSNDIVFYVSYNLDNNPELRMFAEKSMSQKIKQTLSA